MAHFAALQGLVLSLLLSAYGFGQTHEKVTFRYEGSNPGWTPFVSGDLPDLGGSDLGKSIQLVEVEDDVWEVDVELPVNREYTYQFFRRRINQVETPNPSHGIALGDPISASTSQVEIDPAEMKSVRYRGTIPDPVLHWRQDDGDYQAEPLAAEDGDWKSGSVGESSRALEFFFTNTDGAMRDPAALGGVAEDDPTYSTAADAFWFQGGQIFAYDSPVDESVSPPRRDYDPENPPTVDSKILGEARGYRVLLPRGYDQSGRHFPVLYFADGNTLFEDAPDAPAGSPKDALDPEGATLSGLIAAGQMHEVIAVGVHPAATTLARIAELDAFTEPAKNFANFLRLELMPTINEKYRTLAGAEHTAFSGYQIGGTFALYLGWDFSDYFGKVGVFSPEPNDTVSDVFTLEPKRDGKIYLDSGERRFHQTRALRNALLAKTGSRYAIGEQFRYHFTPDVMNLAGDVRARFAEALPFLFPADERVDPSPANAPTPYWLATFGLTTADWDKDADGDGWTTRVEYSFGTDPTDASAFPDFGVEVVDGDALFSWKSQPGVAYQLEQSIDMEAWLDYGGVIWGTGEAFEGAIALDGAASDELYVRMNVRAPIDSDRDGLTDVEESVLLGTKPDEPDTDRDGFPDGEEVLFLGTDPLVPNSNGGSIAGGVYLDENEDGAVAGDAHAPGSIVFLDLDYDKERDANEPFQTVASDGSYKFEGVAPGTYHVVQELPLGWIQTLPGGVPPTPDGLPDTLVSFEHSGEGAFTEPYGLNPTSKIGVPIVELGRDIDLVDPELILKPIGVRADTAPIGVYSTNELLSVSRNSSFTVKFEGEEIFDGPGDDFVIVSLGAAQAAGERIDIWVGATADDLVYLGTADEGGNIGIDLERFDINYPIQYVKGTSLNNKGSFPGFELVGLEAINYLPVDSTYHRVTVKTGQAVTGIDFGRVGRDRPPRAYITMDTGRIKAGDTFGVRITATDDFGVASYSLKANGAAVPLDEEGNGAVTAQWPGELVLAAEATDVAGQVGFATLNIGVANEDGSTPADPNIPSLEERVLGAPQIRIESPGSGEIIDADAPVVATITDNALTNWQLHYALVTEIDPYSLATEDPDYTLLAEGTEVVVNDSLGTFRASALADGIYFLRVTATGGGLTAYSGHAFGVRVDPSELFPVIAITSPETGDEVTYITDVVGSITSEQTIREWFVEAALASDLDLGNLGNTNGATFTRIAEGTGALEPGSVLAKFDSTLFENNSYVLKVTAWNEIGLGRTEGVLVNVCGETKLGRLRTEFTDLKIDLAGVPIEIKRVYDSFASDRSGDFGYGWSIGYADPQLNETDSDGGAVFSARAWKPGTRLYLNSPSGKRVGFTFGLELVTTGFLGSNYRATFTPDPGVYETLEVPEGDAGFLGQNGAGDAVLSFISLPYNPDEFILTTKDGLRYTYNQSIGLVDVRDEIGNALTFSDGGIKHTSGAAVTFSRDASGRITQITGPGGKPWVYEYDVAGDLVGVTDPGEVKTTLSYHSEPAHYLEKVTDPLGRIGVRYEYDEDGRLAATIDENGNRSEQVWDLEGFSGTLSDFRGNVTTVRYDGRGNILQEELPNGGVIMRAYEDPANPDLETSVTNPNGHTTTYAYDARGNETKNQPPVGRSWATTYDEDNKVTQRKYPDLRTEDLTYETNGRLSERYFTRSSKETFGYDAKGNIASFTSVQGGQFLYEYQGGFGQLSAVVRGESREEASYDRRGLPSKWKSANGGESVFEFNESAQPVEVRDPYGAPTTLTYEGEEISGFTDPVGVVTEFGYDAKGRVTKESMAGALTTYGFDPDGNLESVRDPVGNSTAMEYDAGNNLLVSTDPAGQKTTHLYDLAGNRIQTIDRNGRKRTFSYDELNRMIAERWHDPADDSVLHEILMTYNRDQKLVTVTDGDVAYKFTNLQSPEVTTFGFLFPGLEEQLVRYSYVNQTQVSEIRLGIARYHQFRQDGLGDVNVIHMLSPDSDFSARADVLRNGAGQPEEIWRYDTSSILAGEDRVISRTRVDFDLTDRVMSIVHTDASGAPYPERGTLTYTRNAARGVATVDDGANVASYGYGSRRDLVSVENSTRANESFGYDLNGNRNGAGYETAEGNRLIRSGQWEFGYDGEGNMTRRHNTATGEITDLTWDYRNRLTRVDIRPAAGAEAEQAIDYIYDYRDLQIGRIENGVTTWTFYGTDRMPLYEFTGDDPSPTAVYYYIPDVLDRFVGVWRKDRGMRWMLTDHIGSVRAVCDATGTQVASVDYDVFGNVVATTEMTPGDAGKILFAGRCLDATTGIYYNRARWYDPTIARFVSEDPIGFDGGDRNLYRYTANDPANATDPTGLVAAVEDATLKSKVTPATTTQKICRVGGAVGKVLAGVAIAINLAAGDGTGGYKPSPSGGAPTEQTICGS